jgi:hypothetical protein
MTYSGQQAHFEISAAHNVALRKEISEQLGTSLDRNPTGMSPFLSTVMRQWREKLKRHLVERGTDQSNAPKPNIAWWRCLTFRKEQYPGVYMSGG